jgi:ribonuclease/clavin/mitogillin
MNTNLSPLLAVQLLTTQPTSVWRILALNPSPYTLQGSNIYLVGASNHKYLIDAGDGANQQYLDNLKDLLVSSNTVTIDILITHYHHDHSDGIHAIQQFFAQSNQPKVYKYLSASYPGGYNSYIELEESSEFLVDKNLILQPILTSGHSVDHVSYLLKEKAVENNPNTSHHILFSGDHILGSNSTTMFNNLYDYMKSLEKILNLNPKLIYPGHGDIISKPRQYITDYLQHRNMREEQIIDKLSNNKQCSASELMKLIYGAIDNQLFSAAKQTLFLHLHKLIEEKRVKILHSNEQLQAAESKKNKEEEEKKSGEGDGLPFNWSMYDAAAFALNG